MTLRWRLGLTIALSAVVLAAGLLWLQASLDRNALERGLREFVLTYMQTVGRQECEAAPEFFPDRGTAALPGAAADQVPTGTDLRPAMDVPFRRGNLPISTANLRATASHRWIAGDRPAAIRAPGNRASGPTPATSAPPIHARRPSRRSCDDDWKTARRPRAWSSRAPADAASCASPPACPGTRGPAR